MLTSKLPPGLEVNSITLHSGNLPPVTESRYTLCLPRPIDGTEVEMAERFMAADEFVITRTRKGKTRNIDIRPLISELSIHNEDTFVMRVITRTAEPGIKPSDALQHIFGMTETEALSYNFV